MGVKPAALWFGLVALASTLAAALAHVTIDVAGDYVLAHDAYDGVSHHARVLLVATAGALLLALCCRVVVDALHRRCGRHRPTLLRSIRETLGLPWRFIAASSAGTTLALAAMEAMDCAMTHARIDDPSDLFGGSFLLGIVTALACGTIAGWLVHRCARALASAEPAIALFVATIAARLFAELDGVVAALHRHRRSITRSTERGLLLSTCALKRGPPVPAPI